MDTSHSVSPQVLWNDLELEPVTTPVREDRTHRIPVRVTVGPEQVAHRLSASSWTLSSGRRLLDFCSASVGITLFSPVLCVIAACVRVSSPGPVIFRQKRVGRFGQSFTIYKFRTMEAGPKRTGLTVTRHGDRRITRVGSVLRKYKLDELPQLVNVLFGDMSLVGPRPKLPDHQESVNMPFRPGITGAATLVFRCEEEMLKHIPDHELEAFCLQRLTPYKAKIDFEYAKEATLASDLKLLCKTADACLRGGSAPQPHPMELI